MPFHLQKFPGIKKVNRVLFRVCILFLMAFVVTAYLLYGFESVYGVFVFLSQPVLIALFGLCLLFFLPRKIYDTVLFGLLLTMNCYFVFWLYVFLLVGLTGLPPWKMGAGPWM